MNAEEWAAELLRAVRAHAQPGQAARPFTEAGYPLPWGVELRLATGALIYLQATADPSAGTGPPPDAAVPCMEPVELPQEGPTELAAVERWLAWCLTHGPSTRIASVELFQHRRGRVSIPHGLSARARCGARAWVYVRHATPAGRDPASMAVWRAQASV